MLFVAIATVLSPTVRRFVTNHGVLIIETNDPDVQLTATQGSNIKIIDTKTGREIELKAGTWNIELTSDNPSLQLSTNQFDLSRGGQRIVAVRFIPRSKRKLIVADEDNNAAKPRDKVVPDGQPVGEVYRFERHVGRVQCVAVTPDGRVALSGGVDKTLRVWNIKTGDELSTFQGEMEVVNDIDVSIDGRQALIVCSDATIRLWNINDEGIAHFFNRKETRINSAAFIPKKHEFLTGGIDGIGRLRGFGSPKILVELKGHDSEIMDVAVSDDGRYAATASMDGTIRVWDLRDNAHPVVRILIGHRGWVTAIRFRTNSPHVISGGIDATARLWNISDGNEVRSFEGHQLIVRSLAVSADGRRLLTGSDDKTVRLWNVETGTELYTFLGHTDQVCSVTFLPDGEYAVSASHDGTCRVWKLPE